MGLGHGGGGTKSTHTKNISKGLGGALSVHGAAYDRTNADTANTMVG